jgi:hypothetical protein
MNKCIDCKKEISNRSTRCKSCENLRRYQTGIMDAKRKNNSNYIDGRTDKKYYCISCGKEISRHSGLNGGGKCQHCEMTQRPKLLGENHPGWNNGSSFEPYTKDFTEQLKESIRDRDNHECQNCGMTEEEHLIVYGRILYVHHIDYNKKNCKEDNLITTCFGCNNRANFNRDYWQKIYQNKIIILKKEVN